MEITAAMVKTLRDKTGAGMLDCKKALTENKGNMDEAEKTLKKMGLAAVAKRSDRATENGIVSVAFDKNGTATVDVACETDFVAKNKDFVALGSDLAKIVLKNKKDSITDEMNKKVQALIAVIKENMSIRKATYTSCAKDEYIAYYVHNEGALVSLLKFKSDKPEIFKKEDVKTFLRDIAIHAAAFAPLYVSVANVDKKYESEQKDIFMAQVAKLGKPEKVAEGIVKGKLNKLYQEVVLLEQSYLKDEEKQVKDVIAAKAKELGAKIEITDYKYIKAGA